MDPKTPKELEILKTLAAASRLNALRTAAPEDHSLTSRIDALVSYKAYLILLRRCGVQRIPVHGWVAQ